MIDAKANFMICKFHKTATWYGEAGKYMPDIVVKAFAVFLSLPRDKWIFPDSTGSAWIGGAPKIVDAIKDFVIIMQLGWCPTPTLLRKLFVTTIGELVCLLIWILM
jgi:hypothetical protein